ncbi:MAG: hypothetical protein ACOC22_00010 [bacterium]
MGFSTWSDDAYTHLSNNYKSKPAEKIFSKSATKDMSPNGLEVRESRDSDEHPESVAIMVFLDETGSMGKIPELIVKEKLGTLMTTIIDNGVEHPQILFGGIGDHISDRSPLQVGQFESGTEELDKWLTSIYLEGNGGGQAMESYLLAWLVAGRHTSIDCFEKRNTKGFLFTIGDEKSWGEVDGSRLKDLMGYPEASDVTDKQLLEEAQRLYNVYHIHIKEGWHGNNPDVIKYWEDLLGERVIMLDDYNAVCETIATIIAMQHGVDMASVVSKFDTATAGTVTNALTVMSKTTIVVNTPDEGIIKL